MTDVNTIYRLTVLYMLDRVEYPLTNSQITNFILEKEYTNYFTIQQILVDLQSSELITAESSYNNTHYHLTKEGKSTLEFFKDKLSESIKSDIRKYFDDKYYELKDETSIYSDYYKSSSGYTAECSIRNVNKPVLELKFNVSTEEQAKAICTNWKFSSTDTYVALMDLLLK